MSVGRTQFRDVDALQKYWDWTKEEIVAEIHCRVNGDRRSIEKPNRILEDTIEAIAEELGIEIPPWVLHKHDKRRAIREAHPHLGDEDDGSRFEKYEVREIIASLDRGDRFDGG